MHLVENVLQSKQQSRYQLMNVLLDLQKREGFLPEAGLKSISNELDIPLIEIARVANFYNVFSLQPRGKHLVTICTGTACHVRTAPVLFEEIQSQYGIASGETTKDGLFTFESVNCLGACGLGPVVVLDGVYHHHMTPRKLRRLLRSVGDGQGGDN